MATNKIQILYEDEDVLVINKPAGLVVHADGRIKEPTVVDWILKKYPEIRGVGDPSPDPERTKENADLRPGIVHRLDRETSGALIIAKNQTAFVRLKKQFQRQLVHKTYQAFVYGSMKNDDGLIDMPIARSRSNPVLWSASRGKKGEVREAVTEYQVLSRLPAQAGNKGFTFVELYPRTGRTHQLRVHLKAINYPIVSDRLYASHLDPALGFTRLALHSRLISFLHPTTGKRMTVEAPYLKDFEEAFKIFKHEIRNPKS